MDEKEETTETYNKSARALADKFRSMGARVDDIKKAFSYAAKKNPSVLEIGCGDGRDAKEIVKHTLNYMGIDISEAMVKIAKEYVPEGKFEVADIETFKFPKNIDIIISFASLLHSDEQNIKSILERAYYSLNNEGIFYISLKFGEGKETKTDEFGRRTYYYHTPEKIRGLAGDRFKILEKITYFLLEQKWFTIILQKA